MHSFIAIVVMDSASSSLRAKVSEGQVLQNHMRAQLIGAVGLKDLALLGVVGLQDLALLGGPYNDT